MASTYSTLGASAPKVILTSSSEGDSNYKNWKAAALAAAGAMGILEYLTNNKTFDGSLYTEHPPSLPLKVPSFEESRGETDEQRTLRRQVWSAKVNESHEDMRHYEFLYTQFEKNGRPAALAKFNQKAAQAVALIYALVTPEIASNFEDGATAYQLWEYLATHYGTRSELYQSTSLSDILNTRLTEEDTPQRTWDIMSRRAAELQATDYAIPAKLLQKIFLQLFFDNPLFSYPYNKYRSQDLHSNDSKHFKAFLEEVTVCYGDARTKNGSSTNGLFGGIVPGKSVPPAAGISNNVDATIKCQQCNQVGHRNYFCKKWRAKNPHKQVRFDVTDKVGDAKVGDAKDPKANTPANTKAGKSGKGKGGPVTKGMTADEETDEEEECNIALDGLDGHHM